MITRSHLGMALLVAVLVPGFAGAESGPSRWNVVEAGAKPDGVTNVTAVFQKLLDEAGAAGGGVVEVPAGRFRISTGLSIPANVTLQGIYRVPPTSGPVMVTNLAGSVLFAYAGRGSADGPPFIKLAGNNSAIAGLVVAYPEWKQTDVPPVPYPPCVSSQDTENVGVRDCLLLNPYEGIKLVRAHRHLVRNVTGYPIKRGIFVDECYDIGHIENVHFWPFGVSYDPNNPFCNWVNTQGVAFELARTDWHYVFNTFCFGYGIGYKFSKSNRGSANGNFLGLGADSCQRAVVVEQTQPPGLLISNGEFVGRWSSTNAVCLDIEPGAEGKVSLVNCSFWGPIDRCVWMRSAVGQFTASACNFVNWDNRGVGSPAIQLDTGKAIVQGCTFAEENLHVQVGSNVTSAILTANQATGGFQVENRAGIRAQIALNEADSIQWTPAALAHYRVQVGNVGDGHYLRGWHGREGGVKSFRWSMAISQLTLPVIPGERYTIKLEAQVPDAAVSADAGLYLNVRQLAPLKAGAAVVAEIPPAAGDRLRLELRSQGWVPKKLTAGSDDARTLGVQVSAITMSSASAGINVFDANTGGTMAR
jgi:hypothetical protein